MRSLPEDLAILYRKRTKSDAGADSADQSREEKVKAIVRFLQVEVESREEGRLSCEKGPSGRTSVNRKVADVMTLPHLQFALALAAPSSSPGATSIPGPTTCPLCGFQGHVTRDCRATLSAEEKRQ